MFTRGERSTVKKAEGRKGYEEQKRRGRMVCMLQRSGEERRAERGKEGRRAEEGRKEYNQSDKGNVKERRQEGGKKEGYHIRN